MEKNIKGTFLRHRNPKS
ncbi:hypothetical protein Bhyg_04377 [Pseudolycoriella hygida]|uniref:Uncharacterized protein n=1 Tax=Pseudolycoriella hygida TaxID=35572 RepID=A0A9Q0NGM5_9DIPT|nr:hypothetical protein Bhyg_04377 [Pseudolycoriella hygida]